jgi:hypothetical protein
LFSSMDESVSGAARQGGTGQRTYDQSFAPLHVFGIRTCLNVVIQYIPNCKTVLLFALLLLGCASELCKNTRGSLRAPLT